MIIPLSTNYIDKIIEIEKESFSSPWTKRIFTDFIKSPFAVCFAAADGNGDKNEDRDIYVDEIVQTQSIEREIVGYAMMYHVFSEGQIQNIAVKSVHRGKKFATEMLNALLEYARGTDIEILTLEVRQSNTPAIELYKKFGFKSVGIRKNYYRMPVENAILMTMIV